MVVSQDLKPWVSYFGHVGQVKGLVFAKHQHITYARLKTMWVIFCSDILKRVRSVRLHVSRVKKSDICSKIQLNFTFILIVHNMQLKEQDTQRYNLFLQIICKQHTQIVRHKKLINQKQLGIQEISFQGFSKIIDT